LEGGEPGDGDGRGLLEAEVVRLGRQLVLWSNRVLGEGAVAPAEEPTSPMRIRTAPIVKMAIANCMIRSSAVGMLLR